MENNVNKEIKIRLELLKLLRKDRERKFCSEDILNQLKKESIPELEIDEVENTLYEYIGRGIAFSRLVGDSYNEVYSEYSLTKRKNSVYEGPDYMRIEYEWLMREV